MDLLVVVLAIVCFYGLRFSWAGHADYINRGQTDSIKGIFAIIILYSHMRWGIIPPPQALMIVYSFLCLISSDN